MQAIRWNKKHEVFLPELDAEHREIFRVAEALRVAAADGSLERIRSLLDELKAEIEGHLRHEERLMRETGYPSFEWHKKQHEAARKRVRNHSKQAAAGDIEAVGVILDFLGSWLADHTATADRMMTSFVRNRRLQKSAAAAAATA